MAHLALAALAERTKEFGHVIYIEVQDRSNTLIHFEQARFVVSADIRSVCEALDVDAARDEMLTVEAVIPLRSTIREHWLQ